MSAWRTVKPCADCPFNAGGPGLRLRKSLRRGRWAEILSGLRAGMDFTCHKSTRETDDGETVDGILCAGAIDWQEKHGVSGQLHRIMERLDAVRSRSA